MIKMNDAKVNGMFCSINRKMLRKKHEKD